MPLCFNKTHSLCSSLTTESGMSHDSSGLRSVTLCKQFAGLCPVRFWTEVHFITGAIVVVFMKNK